MADTDQFDPAAFAAFVKDAPPPQPAAPDATALPQITVRPDDTTKTPPAAKNAADSSTFDPNEFSNFKKRSLLQSATDPITGIPAEYSKEVDDTWNQMKRGYKALVGSDTPLADQVTGEKPEGRLAGAADLTMGTLGYLSAPLNAPIHSILGKPIENATSSPLLGSLADIGASFLLPIPKKMPGFGRAKRVPDPVPEDPFGVTLSEGERTQNLKTRQDEQAAMLNQSGKPAYDAAQPFVAQRERQLEASKDVAAAQLHPAGDVVARTPEEAGEVISGTLKDREAARQAALAAEEDKLRPPGTMIHPYDAADTVADTLRDTAGNRATAAQSRATALNEDREAIRSSFSPTGQVLAANPTEAADIVSAGVTRAEEEATAARDRAYDRFKTMPGQFKPTVFVDIGNRVRRTFNDPADTFILNEKTTPNALAAIDDLDRTLGAPAAKAVDPDTKAFKPFTPSVVNDAEKKLNAYWVAARNAARTTNDYSDLAAMNRVKDSFSDIVDRALKNRKQFDGDGRAVGDAWDAAQQAHADLRKTFSSQGKGDVVGPIMEKIVGLRDGQAAPANQINNWTTGDGGTPVLVGRRLRQIFGKDSLGQDSYEVGAIKQALWSKAIEPADGVTPYTPQKIADNINKLRNSPLAREYFSPPELERMRQHAQDTSNSVSPPTPKTDKLSGMIDGINGAGGQPWTSGQLADKIFTTKPDAVKFAQYVKGTYGEDSEAFKALQRGHISTLVRAREGRAGFDPVGISKDIRSFLDSDMADTIFPKPEVRNTLAQYADRLDSYAKRSGAPTDPAEALMRKLSNAGPQEIVNALSGRMGYDKATSLDVIKRLKQTLPPDKFAAVKQGFFRQMIEPGPKENGVQWTPRQVTQKIGSFFNDHGAFMKAVYSPDDLSMIRAYQNMHKQITVPKGAVQGSNHSIFWRGVVKAAAYAIGATMAGLVLPVHGLVGELASGAAGAAAVYQLGAYNQARQARRITELLPMVGDRTRAYLAALDASKRGTPLPGAKTRAVVAGSALVDALRQMGLRGESLQSLGPAAAGNNNKDNVQGPAGQKQNGGAVPGKPQTRAHGGRVTDSAVSRPAEHPVIPGARMARDGSYYLPDRTRPGKYVKIVEYNGR